MYIGYSDQLTIYTCTCNILPFMQSLLLSYYYTNKFNLYYYILPHPCCLYSLAQFEKSSIVVLEIRGELRKEE